MPCEVCEVEIVAFGVEEICCWFLRSTRSRRGIRKRRFAGFAMAKAAYSDIGGVIPETLAGSLGALLVSIAAVPAVLACVLCATEPCCLDGACCVATAGTNGTLVSNADVAAAEAFEIAGAGETSDSVDTDAVGLPTVCAGVADVAVPSPDDGMLRCVTKSDVFETPDVDVALELKLGASCDVLSSSRGLAAGDIFRGDATTVAKLVRSVGGYRITRCV